VGLVGVEEPVGMMITCHAGERSTTTGMQHRGKLTCPPPAVWRAASRAASSSPPLSLGPPTRLLVVNGGLHDALLEGWRESAGDAWRARADEWVMWRGC